MNSLVARNGERGASIIELALITPVLAMLVFGVVDLSRAYQLQIRLEAAAKEGANHATLWPDEFDCDGDDDIAGNAASEDETLATTEGYTVTAWRDEHGDGVVDDPLTGCDSENVVPGDRVRVEVHATHRILTPLIGAVVGETLTIEGSTEIEVLG